MQGPKRPSVVIVGCGFGGLFAARALKQAPVDVLLIDRNNYHLFQPLLYQVASAALAPADIAPNSMACLKVSHSGQEKPFVTAADHSMMTLIPLYGMPL